MTREILNTLLVIAANNPARLVNHIDPFLGVKCILEERYDKGECNKEEHEALLEMEQIMYDSKTKP